jgi:hypothetical protein
VGEFAREPRAREPPITHHRLRRNLKDLSGLVDGQSAEETQLDLVENDPRSASSASSNAQTSALIAAPGVGTSSRSVAVACPARPACPPRLTAARALAASSRIRRMTRAHRKEVRSIGPIQTARVDQAEKRLVDERRRLQRVPRPFRTQTDARVSFAVIVPGPSPSDSYCAAVPFRTVLFP